jgi:signal transduction histidine kinase/CheY-like chemotaxis protein
VPIDHDGQMVGMLLAVRSNAVAFGPDAVRVATLVAGQASAALENARLYRAVRAELGERLRAEEERQRLEAELRRAQKAEAMAIFAGGIAHDYNNLLLAVIGNLELARLELAEGTRAYRETGHALDAAVQAADLTHKFMSVSTATGPSKALVPPCEVVQTAVRRATSGTPVVVDVRCAEALPMVPADRDQVEQALTALVVNACEATPAGGRVEVRAERRPPHDAVSDWVTISVRDQGHGIAPDVLPRIFDPYFTTKPRGPAKGTGLGLAIAQAVVARHGGRIEVDTTPGGGSTFAVWLPAAAGQVVVHGTRDAAPEPLPQEARRILVLEDDENVATLAVAMLERLGYTDVELAAEGGDAVELFVRARERGAPFTIAILDLTVRGGMGGRETLQRLLEIDPSLRAIVSSGYSTDPVVANYRAHGFCGSLPKPYRLEQLSRALDAALEV